MLKIENNPFMLSVIMLNVITLSVIMLSVLAAIALLGWRGKGFNGAPVIKENFKTLLFYKVVLSKVGHLAHVHL